MFFFFILQQNAGWKAERGIGTEDERIEEIAADTAAEVAAEVAKEVAEDAVTEKILLFTGKILLRRIP